MKREDLTKLGIAEDLVDKIMALHGSDIEAHKNRLTTSEAALKSASDQLAEANQTIDGFKAMNIDQIKASADEYKTKFEQAQKDAASQVAQLKFDHALDGALSGAKAKNGKAVRALLSLDGLKYNEADGSIVGLKEQLEKIRSENDYLFENDTPAPKIVTGGNNKQVLSDPVILAARKAAGLPTGE